MASIEEKPAATAVESSGPNARVHAHSKTEQLHEFRENEGYVVDLENGAETAKLASDGHTRLIPQPSDDPQDPLNWSWGKKHLLLFIVSLTALLPDALSATGAVTLIPQAE